MSDTLSLRIVAEDGYFHTLQGEGLCTGVPSTFIRLAGCDLRCNKTAEGRGWNCDTPLSLPDYDIRLKRMQPKPTRFAKIVTVESIVERVEADRPSHVVITGGEPTLQAGAVAWLLMEIDSRASCHRTLETNGRHFYAPLAHQLEMLSVSPKVYDPTAIDIKQLELWMREPLADNHGTKQVKIVLGDADDLAAKELMFDVFRACRSWCHEAILIVQMGWDTFHTDATRRVADLVATNRELRTLDVSFGIQSHKLIGLP